MMARRPVKPISHDPTDQDTEEVEAHNEVGDMVAN